MLAVVEQPALANVEAEAALLGALMTPAGRGLIDTIADRLSAEHFAEPLHGRIFEAVVDQHAKGRAVSPITLKPLFADDAHMREVGGPSYLAQLTGSGAAIVGARDLAEQIRELAERRILLDQLRDIIADGQRAELPVVAAALEEALASVQDDRSTKNELTGGDCVEQALNYTGYGITCGIPEIDRVLGPIVLKDLVVLAGRPGMGKTATAISYAIGAAERGHGVLLIEIEMSGVQLGARMASEWCFDRGDAQVPFDAITSGKMDQAQKHASARAALALSELPLVVVDAGRITIGQIERLTRRWKRRFEARGQKLELVVVDYLQRVRPDGKSDGRTHEITQVSMGLKETAKNNDVGVLALAQLSREVEKRHDKRPTLSDLRESGQIEQDADSILFLFRPEYYVDLEEPAPSHPDRIEWEQSKSKVLGKLELICAKRRQGRTGVGECHFYGNFQAVR